MSEIPPKADSTGIVPAYVFQWDLDGVRLRIVRRARVGWGSVSTVEFNINVQARITCALV